MPLLDYLLVALVTGAPIIIAALGEAIVERSGRVNLGVEGIMAFSASASVLVASTTGSPIAGLLGGLLAGFLISTVYLIPVIVLKMDQIVVGLILSLSGLGLADLLASLGHMVGPSIPQGSLTHQALILATATLPLAVWVALYKTVLGVELRAIGFDEVAARERGLRVDLIRGVAVLLEGALVGLAGAYMALILYGGKYFSGITGGWGWLAIGSVILGYWHPLGVAIAAYTIGLLLTLRPLLASLGLGILATISPYIAVIIALALISIISTKKPHIRPPKVM